MLSPDVSVSRFNLFPNFLYESFITVTVWPALCVCPPPPSMSQVMWINNKLCVFRPVHVSGAAGGAEGGPQ